MSHHRARFVERRRNERGAGLVELAMVAMLLVFLVASTFDYGFAWRAGLAVNESARAGARVGSGQALSPGADYYALNSVKSSLTSAGILDNVDKVVIFKSTTSDGKVPADCLLATPGGVCNVLTGAQLKALTAASFDVTISSNPATAPTGTGCLKSTAA
ncbi:MAG: TadE/TadG family type IV pilus assembly protein, partial [Aquihabitans sp.]